jgi:hypothetical protein
MPALGAVDCAQLHNSQTYASIHRALARSGEQIFGMA